MEWLGMRECSTGYRNSASVIWSYPQSGSSYKARNEAGIHVRRGQDWTHILPIDSRGEQVVAETKGYQVSGRRMLQKSEHTVRTSLSIRFGDCQLITRKKLQTGM